MTTAGLKVAIFAGPNARERAIQRVDGVRVVTWSSRHGWSGHAGPRRSGFTMA